MVTRTKTIWQAVASIASVQSLRGNVLVDNTGHAAAPREEDAGGEKLARRRRGKVVQRELVTHAVAGAGAAGGSGLWRWGRRRRAEWRLGPNSPASRLVPSRERMR